MNHLHKGKIDVAMQLQQDIWIQPRRQAAGSHNTI
jgi:hypothetical protein